MGTKIPWCDETINPIKVKGGGYHCTKISPGCDNCYAERTNMNGFMNIGNYQPFDGRKVEFELDEATLQKPLHWKRPRKIFVQSMGDLFHEDVPREFIDKVYGLIAACKLLGHTFILLTKRPQRALEYYSDRANYWLICKYAFEHLGKEVPINGFTRPGMLKNVWFGVTAENQEMADKRIPILLQIPAAVRFVSCEPLLGPIDLAEWMCCKGEYGELFPGFKCKECDTPVMCMNYNPALDWIIVGGETGPNARPIHPDWVRSLRDQCQNAGTPFFFKSWGKKIAGDLLDGKQYHEFPKVT